jgi:broad specificity phosphatase PhoE
VHTLRQPDSTFLLLIRHGATDCNLATPPRLQGRGINLGLSADGRRQAELTAAYLSGIGLDAVYSSPLHRAWQTAEAIARPHDLSIEAVDELVEVDVGAWENCSWPDIAANHPEAYSQFLEDCGEYGYLGGENMRQVQQRVTPVLSRLLEANLGKLIAVVSHSVVNRAYVAGLLNIPLAHCRHLPQDNCGINVVLYRASTPTVATVNSVFHLEPIQAQAQADRQR